MPSPRVSIRDLRVGIGLEFVSEVGGRSRQTRTAGPARTEAESVRRARTAGLGRAAGGLQSPPGLWSGWHQTMRIRTGWRHGWRCSLLGPCSPGHGTAARGGDAAHVSGGKSGGDGVDCCLKRRPRRTRSRRRAQQTELRRPTRTFIRVQPYVKSEGSPRLGNRENKHADAH